MKQRGKIVILHILHRKELIDLELYPYSLTVEGQCVGHLCVAGLHAIVKAKILTENHFETIMEPLNFSLADTMASLTVKNIPEDLYEQLKHAASVHHRSINSELIVCLEKVLLPKRLTPDERLSAARSLRESVNPTLIDAAELDEAKRAGRP